MKNAFTNYAAKNGAIIGGAYIVSYLLFYLLHGKLHTLNDMSGNLNLLFLVVGVILFTRKYQGENNITYFSYGDAFKMGFYLSFFAAIIGAFFLYLFYKGISPESVDQYRLLQQNAMLQMGYTEEQVEGLNGIMAKFIGPGFLAFSTFVGNVIMGVIVSLITAIFLKRGTQDPNAFNRDMSKIDKG